MTKIVYLCLVLGACALYGCTEQAAETTPEAVAAEVIELSEEELDMLEVSSDSSEVDLGEINADNYEEALEKLEKAIEAE